MARMFLNFNVVICINAHYFFFHGDRPPVSLTMALSPARYAPSLLHSVPPPPILNREPTPKQDTSDNDGKWFAKCIFIFNHSKLFVCINAQLRFCFEFHAIFSLF